MARIYPLFSSSEGNASYIGTKKSGILIDCGVSYKRLCCALAVNGIDISAVEAVFITHEHSDHVSGLKMLTKKTGIPVYSQDLTLDVLYDKQMILSDTFDMNGKVKIGDMTVQAYRTSHDAVKSCCYKITFSDGTSAAVCTDLGYVSDSIADALYGCDAVILESNYDEKMLRQGDYPLILKQRIRSDIGHLSNEQSGEFAAELVGRGTKYIILGHLSQNNNTPQTAEYTVESIIAGRGYQRGREYVLSVAPVETSGCYISF